VTFGLCNDSRPLGSIAEYCTVVRNSWQKAGSALHHTVLSARNIFDAHLKSIVGESNADGPGIGGWAGEVDFGNTII